MSGLPKTVAHVPIKDIKDHISSETPVTVRGWVTNCRIQKSIGFLELRDGTSLELFQIVLNKELTEQARSEGVCEETALTATGLILAREKSKGGCEMKVQSFTIVGPSSPTYNTLLDHASTPAIKRKIRHLSLRHSDSRLIFSLRSKIHQTLRKFFFKRNFTEVNAPSIVMNQVEGGSTLFKVDYFGEEAYLTQSSQLYLESMVPVVGDCFSLMTNYRAEKSHTRRHLAEYTHLETEQGFITFEDLLTLIEDTIFHSTKAILEKYGKEVEKLNPGFTEKFEILHKKNKGKFKRMTHKEAIIYCNENGILNDEGKQFEEEEDISESPERRMIEMIGEPVLLMYFPASHKPFYMPKCGDKMKETLSVDLLVPGVGEILGGSMREWKYEELKERFEKEGLCTEKYKWYLDLRKYGCAKTGGYGLGVDRFLCWVLGQDNIRDVVAYPRYSGHCYP